MCDECSADVGEPICPGCEDCEETVRPIETLWSPLLNDPATIVAGTADASSWPDTPDWRYDTRYADWAAPV